MPGGRFAGRLKLVDADPTLPLKVTGIAALVMVTGPVRLNVTVPPAWAGVTVALTARGVMAVGTVMGLVGAVSVYVGAGGTVVELALDW